MDERIKDHLQYLNKYYLQLADMRRLELEAFSQDSVLRGAAERFLQLAIESCLNIGNRLIALYQFQKPMDSPQTYADIFLRLRDLGVIDSELADRMVTMAKFRNRLVHLYWEIDTVKIFEIIQDNLEDFKLFEKKVVEFLMAQSS
jgi:uncharacterized protein YutE (UPF0331/DUF86 family)